MKPSIFFFFLFIVSIGCSTTDTPMPPDGMAGSGTMEKEDYKLPEIDLSNWKVTLPIGNPTEIRPPAILDYARNTVLHEYMYNDSTDGSLVFYTIPNSSTNNSKYSRTELREQVVAGSDRENWTFGQGGTMTGRLKVARVSGDIGNLDRIIVMQIHGRLTDEQRTLIGADDNNAPPVLKIYWDDGKINVRRKILKDLSTSDSEMLKSNAWKDESYWFDEVVGYNSFEIRIEVTAGSLKVSLGTGEAFLFDDIHVEKWAVFENYFKAGNYLQTIDEGSFSEVKYYTLKVTH